MSTLLKNRKWPDFPFLSSRTNAGQRAGQLACENSLFSAQATKFSVLRGDLSPILNLTIVISKKVERVTAKGLSLKQ